MSLTALQGATLIATHAAFSKMLISFTLRTYQYLESDSTRVKKVTSNRYVQQFEKAQVNESEYVGLFTALLLYISLSDNEASLGPALAVVGQVGYVWTRTLLGYPSMPTITFAVIRYGGLFLLVSELWKQTTF